jgi:Transketolase, C-terminal domain
MWGALIQMESTYSDPTPHSPGPHSPRQTHTLFVHTYSLTQTSLLTQTDCPALQHRYPRGVGLGLDLAAHGIGPDMKGTPLEIGRAVLARDGGVDAEAAIVAYGSSVNEALAAAAALEATHGVRVTVCDARFCKPLDTDMVRGSLASRALAVPHASCDLAAASATCPRSGKRCCCEQQALLLAGAARCNAPVRCLAGASVSYSVASSTMHLLTGALLTTEHDHACLWVKSGNETAQDCDGRSTVTVSCCVSSTLPPQSTMAPVCGSQEIAPNTPS